MINVGSVGEAPSGEGPGGRGAGAVHADATLIEIRQAEPGAGIVVEQFVVPLGKAA